MTYYGIARINDEYAIMRVTKNPGERMVQEWTGESFPSQKPAERRMTELNEEALRCTYNADGTVTHREGGIPG